MSESARSRLDYPFPLEDFMCELWLPRDGLTVAEAERLKAYIDTLVVSENAPSSKEPQ